MTLDMTSKNVVLLLGLFQEITANPSVPIQEVVSRLVGISHIFYSAVLQLLLIGADNCGLKSGEF